jgi:hypothetical protein
MSPSDPDFPYEIEALECTLLVPKTYPETGRPSLKALNKDIPRGFQINIEMAETVKLVVHKGPPSRVIGAKPPSATPVVPPRPVVVPEPKPKPTPRSVMPVFTSQQKEEAKVKRQTNTRQLEARLGRLSSFAKSPDGFSYTIPLDSPKRSTWPSELQPIRSITLLLPELFPLEPSSIMLDSDSSAARNVEDSFKSRSAAGSDSTLMQQINYLTLHMKDMSVATVKDAVPATPIPVAAAPSTDISAVEHAPQPTRPVLDDLDDKSHIKVIPRPPEWDIKAADSDSESSDEDDYSYDSGDDTETSVTADEVVAQPAGAPVEKGVLLSFPQLELHSIELMELTTLNLTIKCERCKDTMDVLRLRNNVSGDAANMRDETCKKCASALAVGFRADLMHAGSVRAGYLDMDGCTVTDMLPR